MLVTGDGKSPNVLNTTPAASHGVRPRLHLEQPPWRLLSLPGTVQIDVPGSPAARRRLAQELRTLRAGTPVVLCSSARGSRRRCRRFASQAGITGLREYVGMPSMYSPTCYVEDTRAALSYFFGQVLALPRGGPLPSALFEAGKLVARHLRPWGMIGAIAPAYMVLGRAGTTSDAAGGSGLLDLQGIQAVVLALSKDPNAKLTVLLIPAGDAQPALVVKVPTTELAAMSIAAEKHALAQVRACLPPPMLGTIPRIAELPQAVGRAHLATTALPGSPMSTRYHAWRHLASRAEVASDFRMAERWLGQFQAMSMGAPQPVDMQSGVVEVLATRFAGDPQLARSLAILGRVYQRLGTATTPRTAVHGDFWFGNLLVARDQVSGVVDWESGSACGEPTRDLVRFALTYALYLDRHSRVGRLVAGHPGLRADRWGAGIEYAIDGQGWFPNLFRGFIQQGLQRLGADPALWRDAARAGIAEVAATADHLDFAERHWRLFERLAVQDPEVTSPGASSQAR
jgi:Phosphotransferase enzyme family